MTARPANRPVQEFFSIGEVCALTDLKPHVLRYWESQFRFLSPSKNRSGNRVYKSREVELILLVKHLLYTEKYTIDGARIRLESYRKNGELKVAARQAAGVETLSELRQAVDQVIAVLDGRVPAESRPAEPAPAPSGEEPGERARGRRSPAKTGFQLSLEPDQP
jgi:DNA-binding transcriptional MerR regulator